MLSNASLWAIAAYQNWISPYKGFRCAYSVLHGGTGCSGYAKGQIKTLGLLLALPKIRARFQACRAAMASLQKKRRKARKKRKADKQSWYDGISCDCPTGFISRCKSTTDAGDCGSCDVPSDVCSCG